MNTEFNDHEMHQPTINATLMKMAWPVSLKRTCSRSGDDEYYYGSSSGRRVCGGNEPGQSEFYSYC